MRYTPIIVAGLSMCSSALASNIYMISSADATTDAAAMLALTSRGHTVTLGVVYTAFGGSVSLAGFDTVYLQANSDWTTGPMPSAGQQQLVDFVNAGGRLVTSEWVMYFSTVGSNFGGLSPILPLTFTGGFTNTATTTLTQAMHNNTISPGVAPSFTCPLTNFSGTESPTVAKPGASTYYTTNGGGSLAQTPALAGWHVGAGYVYSFTSTCGPDQVADANFGRLFSNTMSGITPPCEVAADFNHDGDAGTDADIEDFFRCIAGNCCATCDSADYDGDGDTATDADIETFFRVLAGGGC